MEAINDLYRKELRLFQNLFLPSVKLECKVRVGSRLRRRYGPPLTPLQRLRAGKAIRSNGQLEGLQRLRDTLDPFVLAQQIRTKLDHIFHLASGSQGNQAARSTVPTVLHRLSQKEKSSKKERKNDDDGHLLLPSQNQRTTHLGLHS
jgi:hypothetical protein